MSSLALRLPGLPRPRGQFWTLLTLGVIAMLTLAVHFLGGQRPPPPEALRADVVRVTSGADAGPGTLREAIFTADRAPRRARIVLAASRITLQTPLPPLVNPEGVVLETEGATVEIDGSAIGTRPVLDVAAPHTVVRGFTVRGATGVGVLVQKPHVLLSGLSLTGCAEGVHVAEGSADVTVESSSFAGNGVGILVSRVSQDVVLRGNRFQDHERAGVWAVQSAGAALDMRDRLHVRSNTFKSGAVGLLTANVNLQAEKNTFTGAREMGMFISGPGAVVRDNRVTQGRAYGIYALGVEGAVIEGNETDANAAVGILLRDSVGSVVRRNRVYGNGYGVLVLFGDAARPDELATNLVMTQSGHGLYVVGGSPRIVDNDVRGNGAAALRIDEYVPLRGPSRRSDPLLRDNRLQGNGADEVVRGSYREEAR
jgi:parallel beta-helix repeat protein